MTWKFRPILFAQILKLLFRWFFTDAPVIRQERATVYEKTEEDEETESDSNDGTLS